MLLNVALAALMTANAMEEHVPPLAVSSEALTDDVVVSPPVPATQVIGEAIQSTAVDNATATEGLLSAAKPGAGVGSAIEQRIAGDLIQPR